MSESLAVVRKLLVSVAYSIIFFNVVTSSKGNLSNNLFVSYNNKIPFWKWEKYNHKDYSNIKTEEEKNSWNIITWIS